MCMCVCLYGASVCAHVFDVSVCVSSITYAHKWNTHAHLHTHTHLHVMIHTHIHTNTHTHKHTHTHTCSYLQTHPPHSPSSATRSTSQAYSRLLITTDCTCFATKKRYIWVCVYMSIIRIVYVCRIDCVCSEGLYTSSVRTRFHTLH
jgi:hypothetical protein